MKKYIIVIAMLAFLTACGAVAEPSETTLTVSKTQRDKFNADIDTQLQVAHWTYGTATYTSGKIADTSSENYADIAAASLASGYDITGKEGQSAIIVSVPLAHFNGASAGTAHFYYINDELSCEYFEYNSSIYPLNQTNVYELTNAITKFEDPTAILEFDKSKLNMHFSEYSAISADNKIAVIEDNKISTLSYNNGFVVDSSIDFTAENLFPIDSTFAEDGTLIVLLGKKDEEAEPSHNAEDIENFEAYTETSFTDILSESEKPLKSVSVAFVQNGEVASRLPLNLSNYTAITIDGDKLFMAREKSLDTYTNEGGTWQKTQQSTLKHWVNQLDITDIEGDGIKEYIMSDGTDIYVYHLDNTLEVIWRTYMSLSTIQSQIYIGDLNGDGVKELYVEDNAGITLRYVFNPKSVNIDNGSIITGKSHHYLVGDFNGDKKDDYIQIYTDTDEGDLFIAK